MEQYDNKPNIRLIPPVYLLKSQLRCYLCGNLASVYCLGSNGFVGDGLAVSDFSLFSSLAWLPDELDAVVRKFAPGYYFDYIKQRGSCYFINHCKCRAKLSDHQVHNQAESGFFPLNAEQAGKITLYRITDVKGFEICATPVIHDEDLVFVNAVIELLA